MVCTNFEACKYIKIEVCSFLFNLHNIKYTKEQKKKGSLRLSKVVDWSSTKKKKKIRSTKHKHPSHPQTKKITTQTQKHPPCEEGLDAHVQKQLGPLTQYKRSKSTSGSDHIWREVNLGGGKKKISQRNLGLFFLISQWIWPTWEEKKKTTPQHFREISKK